MKKFVSSENFDRLDVIMQDTSLMFIFYISPNFRSASQPCTRYLAIQCCSYDATKYSTSLFFCNYNFRLNKKKHTEYLVCGSEAVNGILVIYTKL